MSHSRAFMGECVVSSFSGRLAGGMAVPARLGPADPAHGDGARGQGDSLTQNSEGRLPPCPHWWGRFSILLFLFIIIYCTH